MNALAKGNQALTSRPSPPQRSHTLVIYIPHHLHPRPILLDPAMLILLDADLKIVNVVLQHVGQMEGVSPVRDVVLVLVDIGAGTDGANVETGACATEFSQDFEDVAAVNVFIFSSGGGVAGESVGDAGREFFGDDCEGQQREASRREMKKIGMD